MAEGIITKTGNSYAIRVPKSYISNNQLKLGDKVPLQDTLGAQQQALANLVRHASKTRPVPGIDDPVAWQRKNRVSDSPWTER